jgi:hypothetical protein
MENNDKHGLAINILKFQYYNSNYFNCQEVVLFETLIVLGGASFAGKKEFFHSTQTLADKTMIKRHTVDRILKKFKTEGIIDYKIKGMPQVKYLRVLWDNVLELLPEIYQFNKVEEYFGGSTKPLIYFYQQFAENDKKVAENKEQKNIIKNNTEEYKEEYEEEINVYALAQEEENKIKLFLEELNKIFKARINQYNINNKDHKEITNLPVKKSVVNKMYQALKVKKKEDVKNAFIAFSEEMLYMRVKPKQDALSYFLKEEKGEYPVIDRYQLHFIINYSTEY